MKTSSFATFALPVSQRFLLFLCPHRIFFRRPTRTYGPVQIPTGLSSLTNCRVRTAIANCWVTFMAASPLVSNARKRRNSGACSLQAVISTTFYGRGEAVATGIYVIGLYTPWQHSMNFTDRPVRKPCVKLTVLASGSDLL